MQWFNARTNPPTEEGKYLCITRFDEFKTVPPFYNVYDYSLNLESVDEFDFNGEKRPGWYDYDGEWGYWEIERVNYWMPLPALPDELKGE